MKSVLWLSIALSFMLASCQVTTHDEAVVGPVPTQPGIQDVSFRVDTTYMQSSPAMLVVRGLAKNDGTGIIYSPWYVECTFFTDSTLTVVLGSSNDQVGVPLSPGQSAYWEIGLSSTNVDVRRFPDFRVGSFRAFYQD